MRSKPWARPKGVAWQRRTSLSRMSRWRRPTSSRSSLATRRRAYWRKQTSAARRIGAAPAIHCRKDIESLWLSRKRRGAAADINSTGGQVHRHQAKTDVREVALIEFVVDPG